MPKWYAKASGFHRGKWPGDGWYIIHKECVKKVFGGLFAKPKDGKVYPMEPKVEKDLIGYAKKKLGQP